ncbi:MAG: hypothetical protein KDK91_01885, partial [Gammaproteobacteria bacterium]|nr:hypothetical protein [Gammaproteobacteria bacterium]
MRSDPPEPSNPFDAIPDARDGLTRVQRLLLLELWHVQRELDRETVPSAMLYGRLLEHIDLSPAGFREALAT